MARDVGCAASLRNLGRGALDAIPAPALVEIEWVDGAGGRHRRMTLLGRVAEDKVLLSGPTTGVPVTWPRKAFGDAWTGRILTLSPPKGSEVDEDRKPFGLAWFLPAVMKYKHLFIEVAVASFLLQVFGLATPLFFMLIMDKVLVTGGITTLDVLAIGLLAVGLFEFIMGFLRSHLMGYATHRLDVELAARMFRHLSTLPVSFFASRQTGRTTARAAELQTIRTFLTGQAPTALIDLVFTFVFLGVIFFFAPILALVVAVAMAGIFVVHGIITPTLRKRLMAKATNATENQTFLTETVFAMETVKSMAVEPGLQRAWENQMADQTVFGHEAEKLSQNATQIVTLINRVAVVLTLYLGARLVISGDMTPGQLIAVNMMTMRALQPAQRVAQLWQQLHQVLLAVGRLGEILNATPEPSAASAAALPDLKGRVEFQNVSFRYGEDTPEVLSEVSFTVQPGQVVGIVGVSGSGKSTLAKLLQRLYWPGRGRILIDGIDIALVDPSWLRRQVTHVLQDPFLFNKTVRENIALADPTMPLEQVQKAAELTGAHDFIASQPLAYDTVVGERGAKVSGGERQRIVLARALATDPRILVLDEATSALDYEAERLVQKNMGRICLGRTVFIIAHRLSGLRHCDTILVLDQGRLIETGTHEELLAKSGRYASLHALQQGDPPPPETQPGTAPETHKETPPETAQTAPPQPPRDVAAPIPSSTSLEPVQ